MEIKEITPEQIALIKKPLPAEAVSQHPTKTYLSSIKAIYVLERLNDVFWIGVWSIKTNQIGDIKDWMVVVKVIFEIPTYWVYYECFWWNDNWWGTSKNFDLWDAYKWATTDAITKICSYMWIWMDVFKGKQKWSWSSAGTTPKEDDNKPWYNKFDQHIEFFKKEIKDWKTADELIKKLCEKNKVNNKIRQSIKDLESDNK